MKILFLSFKSFLIKSKQQLTPSINKENHLLYAVPYQHFTNSIENYFSMLKSRLQKVHKLGDGLTHSALKENITKVIREIQKYN